MIRSRDCSGSSTGSMFHVSHAHKLETYVELLLTWQKRINLIGPATVAAVWERHILDSFSSCRCCRQARRPSPNWGPAPAFPGW